MQGHPRSHPGQGREEKHGSGHGRERQQKAGGGRKPRRGLFGKPLSQLDAGAAAREQPAEPTCEVPACPAPREMPPARQTPAGLSLRGADAARAVPEPGAVAPTQPQGAERHHGGLQSPQGGLRGKPLGKKAAGTAGQGARQLFCKAWKLGRGLG